MKKLYEILVPTIYGDGTMKPIKTKHHKKWDEMVLKVAGGLTILSPSKGKWTYKGEQYPERVIPVKIMCTEQQIRQIVQFTITHYRQQAVMFYKLSDQVEIIYKS